MDRQELEIRKWSPEITFQLTVMGDHFSKGLS